MKIGRVEQLLNERVEKRYPTYLPLIDPQKFDMNKLTFIKKFIDITNSPLILIGGSTGISESLMDKTIKIIKNEIKIPIVIFPSGVYSISQEADAIFFISLLNSENPYYIIEAQMLASPIIKKYNIETIPVGYLILGEGGVAGHIGWAKKIPYKYAELISYYALAAELLGMRFVYLEAGSGTEEPIPEKVIKKVREIVSIPIIAGGGIKDIENANRLLKAGADIIVMGNVLENSYEKLLKEIAHEDKL
jgi:phosphoglycerol geranylgeranyltransferase